MATVAHDPLHGVDALAHSPQWWDHRWTGFLDPKTMGWPLPVPTMDTWFRCEGPDEAFRTRDEAVMDLVYVVGLAAVILTIRYLVEFILFKRFVAWFRPYGLSKKLADGQMTRKAYRRQQTRLRQTLWRSLVWICLNILGVVCLASQPFFWYRGLMFENWPHVRSVELTVYYWVQTAHAVSLLVAVFVEERQTDFLEMVIHHLLTIGCLGGSWYAGYHRAGAVIQFLHDIADVFLEVAKAHNYAHVRYFGFAGEDVFFVGLIISWIATRLIWFPFGLMYVIIQQTSVPDALCQQCRCITWQIMLTYGLVVLHVYWLYLILRIAFRRIFVSSSKVQDIRDIDSTDEDKQD